MRTAVLFALLSACSFPQITFPGPAGIFSSQVDVPTYLDIDAGPLRPDEELCGNVLACVPAGLLWFAVPLNYGDRYRSAYQAALAKAPGSDRLIDRKVWDSRFMTPWGVLQLLHVEGTAVRIRAARDDDSRSPSNLRQVPLPVERQR
jgi:hypothetical protein